MLQITPLKPSDKERWHVLSRAYMAFYKTARSDSEYEHLWQRLLNSDGVFGLGAYLDGKLLGITHYLFHTSAWTPDVCYLQDLFVDDSVRGQGLGRALIEQVAQVAKERGAPRLYWLTHHTNTNARALYDKVASHSGFIRYERSLVL